MVRKKKSNFKLSLYVFTSGIEKLKKKHVKSRRFYYATRRKLMQSPSYFQIFIENIERYSTKLSYFNCQGTTIWTQRTLGVLG